MISYIKYYEKLVKLWQQLEKEIASINNDLYLRRRIEISSSCDVFIGINKKSVFKTFMIETDSFEMIKNIKYHEADGFSLSVYSFFLDNKEKGRLIVELNHEKYSDIFTVLISDVLTYIDGLKEQNKVIEISCNRILKWGHFLKQHQQNGLSKEKALGLFGELYFIEKFLFPAWGIEKSINSWTGPSGNNQDFQIGKIGIEIKTSASSIVDKINISNIRQLDNSAVQYLILCVISAEIRNNSDNTLPLQVDKIRNIIGDNENILHQFDEKLLYLGYLDNQKGIYEKTTYSVYKEFFFNASATNFPKINQDTLMCGILDVKYSINMSSIKDFAISKNRVSEIILEVC